MECSVYVYHKEMSSSPTMEDDANSGSTGSEVSLVCIVHSYIRTV